MSEEPLVRLSDRERDLLRSACGEGSSPADWDDFNAAVCAAYVRVVRQLPRGVLEKIVSFGDIASEGYLVVRNLPIDKVLPPTPLRQTSAVLSEIPVATSVLLGIARTIGHPYTYRGEYDGSYLTSVLPTVDAVGSSSSHGAEDLPLHTETVHLYPYLPTAIGLLCLRSDPSRVARTTIVLARDLVARCSAQLLLELRAANFWVSVPQSFGMNRMAGGPTSVIEGPWDFPEIRLELSDMNPITPGADRALGEVRTVAASCRREVFLRAGDLLLIDNRKVLHGRNRFPARLDGTDRWLLRALVTTDLWPWREHLSQGGPALF